MNEAQEECLRILEYIEDAEVVTNLFLNWLGLQVLGEDFLEFLNEEGYY